MSGRRSHHRYEVLQPPLGVLRVMQDVHVQSAGEGELIAISREPGVLGESVTIDVQSEDGPCAGVRARVVESQPIVVEGAVRHRVRLVSAGAV